MADLIEVKVPDIGDFEDVPIIDFVQYVQAGAVKAALTGPDASLPVLSEAAPFSRTASFPQGQVSVRDVAGLRQALEAGTAAIGIVVGQRPGKSRRRRILGAKYSAIE